MVPEEKGIVRRHAKTGWGKHYGDNIIIFSTTKTFFEKVRHAVRSLAKECALTH